MRASLTANDAVRYLFCAQVLCYRSHYVDEKPSIDRQRANTMTTTTRVHADTHNKQTHWHVIDVTL